MCMYMYSTYNQEHIISTIFTRYAFLVYFMYVNVDNMCICVCVCVCMCVCMCMHACVFVCVYARTVYKICACEFGMLQECVLQYSSTHPQ